MDERPPEGPEPVLPVPGGMLRSDPTQTFAARLDAWVADARIESSADARARERWLHQAAEADSNLAGVLLDFAERHVGVTVQVAGGQRHHGRVEVIGADFIALHTINGTELLVVLAAVTSVRTAPRVQATIGERVVTTDLRLTDVLAQLGAERERAVVASIDGRDTVAGELTAVGQDVARVRTDADPTTIVYIPTASIAVVTLG